MNTHADAPARLMSFHLDDGMMNLEWHSEARRANLTAGGLDELIAGLLQLRRSCPPLPATPSPVSNAFNVALNPSWQTGADAATGEPLVQLCHPSLGWLTFRLPLSEAQHLAANLVTLATAQQPGAS